MFLLCFLSLLFLWTILLIYLSKCFLTINYFYIYLFIYLSIYLPMCLSSYSSIYLLIYLFIYSLIYLFVQLLVYSIINLFVYIYSYSCLHLLFVYSAIQREYQHPFNTPGHSSDISGSFSGGAGTVPGTKRGPIDQGNLEINLRNLQKLGPIWHWSSFSRGSRSFVLNLIVQFWGAGLVFEVIESSNSQGP